MGFQGSYQKARRMLALLAAAATVVLLSAGNAAAQFPPESSPGVALNCANGQLFDTDAGECRCNTVSCRPPLYSFSGLITPSRAQFCMPQSLFTAQSFRTQSFSQSFTRSLGRAQGRPPCGEK